MTKLIRALTTALAVLIFCGVVAAQDVIPGEEQRGPGASLAAAFLNITFTPLRLMITGVGGGLGGFTGLMTGGNESAADDVWEMFRGQNMLTPEIMRGTEALRVGSLEFSSE